MLFQEWTYIDPKDLTLLAWLAGRGEIDKPKHLNEKKQYIAVRDFSFYETRWILKFSFKHLLMNEIEIFLNL